MPELTGLPATGPADAGSVKGMLSIDDAVEDVRVGQVVDAVNARVRSWRVAQAAVGAAEWPADIIEGANMLAVRLYRRKNSPAGVEAFSADGAVYVMRNDPDIAMLLQLGAWAPPQVG